MNLNEVNLNEVNLNGVQIHFVQIQTRTPEQSSGKKSSSKSKSERIARSSLRAKRSLSSVRLFVPLWPAGWLSKRTTVLLVTSLAVMPTKLGLNLNGSEANLNGVHLNKVQTKGQKAYQMRFRVQIEFG